MTDMYRLCLSDNLCSPHPDMHKPWTEEDKKRLGEALEEVFSENSQDRNEKMIRITDISGIEVEYKHFKFSGGEVQVRIKDCPDRVNLFAHLRNSDDIMTMLLLANAIEKMNKEIMCLVIPYVPYARQDRVCYKGEAFSLEVMAALINSMKFTCLVVWDIHSPVFETLIKRPVYKSEAKTFVNKVMQETDIIVSPDHGARFRAMACQKDNRILYCVKIRDPDTGHLSKVDFRKDILTEYPESDLLIVDDICDGGRTFVNLAKALKKHTQNKIKLYVTHGIFSNGFDDLLSVIDEIYVANCFIPADQLPEQVHVIVKDN